MNSKTAIHKLSIVVLACGVIVGCDQGKQDAPVSAAREAVKEVAVRESEVAKYERLYSELLKQKTNKEGLAVNITAETKKKVAEFRQASPKDRSSMLEDLEEKVKKYNAM